MKTFLFGLFVSTCAADTIELGAGNTIPGDDSTNHTFSTPAGSYLTPSNVNSHFQVSRDVGELASKLPTFAEAKTVYTTGVHTSSSGKTLQSRARKDMTGYVSPIYQQFIDHFGEYWMDTWMLSALDGTGGLTDESARAEAAEKGAMDQVLGMMTFVELETAVYKGTQGDTAVSGAVHNWDEAVAYYTGGIGHSKFYSPYGRANKRCQNYGTCDTHGDATANTKIFEAFNAGKTALMSGTYDSTAAQAAADTIVAQIKVTYIQATLRYLWKLDNDVLQGNAYAEHQGEGWAFWRVIEPFFGTAGAPISTMYNMTHTPTEQTHYCTAYNILMDNLPTGITTGDIGTLEHVGSDGVACPCTSSDMICGMVPEVESDSEDATDAPTVTGSEDSEETDDDSPANILYIEAVSLLLAALSVGLLF